MILSNARITLKFEEIRKRFFANLERNYQDVIMSVAFDKIGDISHILHTKRIVAAFWKCRLNYLVESENGEH